MFTLWTGTAVDCFSGIILLHSRFHSNTSIQHHSANGKVIGRSINTTTDNDGVKYILELYIQLDAAAMEGNGVECYSDDGIDRSVIGTYAINYARGKFFREQKFSMHGSDNVIMLYILY